MIMCEKSVPRWQCVCHWISSTRQKGKNGYKGTERSGRNWDYYIQWHRTVCLAQFEKLWNWYASDKFRACQGFHHSDARYASSGCCKSGEEGRLHSWHRSFLLVDRRDRQPGDLEYKDSFYEESAHLGSIRGSPKIWLSFHWIPTLRWSSQQHTCKLF